MKRTGKLDRGIAAPMLAAAFGMLATTTVTAVTINGQAQGSGLRGWQRLGFFPAGIAVMPLAAAWQVHQVSGVEFPTAVTAAQYFWHAVLL